MAVSNRSRILRNDFCQFCLVVGFVVSLTSAAFADDRDSVYKAGFCQRTLTTILEDGSGLSQRIAFRNEGGLLFNRGVCWWHSRLQRAALYLAAYHPNRSKPTRGEAGKIIRALIRMNNVVEIPGYRGFMEFSIDFRDLIQQQLNQWQLRDEFLHGAMIQALKKERQGAERLEQLMDGLYDSLVNKRRITFLKLKINRRFDHAWLLYHLERANDGYQLRVIDSNDPVGMIELYYKRGDQALSYANATVWASPLFEKELDKMLDGIRRYCGSPMRLSD